MFTIDMLPLRSHTARHCFGWLGWPSPSGVDWDDGMIFWTKWHSAFLKNWHSSIFPPSFLVSIVDINVDINDIWLAFGMWYSIDSHAICDGHWFSFAWCCRSGRSGPFPATGSWFSATPLMHWGPHIAASAAQVLPPEPIWKVESYGIIR